MKSCWKPLNYEPFAELLRGAVCWSKKKLSPSNFILFHPLGNFFFKKNIILVSGEASNRNDFPKLTNLHFKNIPTDTHVRRNSSRTTLSEAETKVYSYSQTVFIRSEATIFLSDNFLLTKSHEIGNKNLVRVFRN